MKCTNCGANLKDDASYCIRCGSKINSDGISISNNVNKNRKSLNNYDLDNLLKAYVGNNYNKFIYSSFSILYFLLGPIYGFARRMYSFSIIYIIVNSIVIYISSKIDQTLPIVLSFILLIIFSLNFKKQYINTAKVRVNKIIDNNLDLDIVMLQNKCSKKGGLNILFVILPILIIIISVIVIVLLIINGKISISQLYNLKNM